MSTLSSVETPNKQPSRWQPRLAALFEVCGVYLVGQLIAFILMGLFGLELVNPIETLKANPNADLLEMSKNLALILLFQYGGILLPALAIGWWHRRRRLAAYGLTTGQPLFPAAKPTLAKQILVGVALFAVSELPTKLLTTLDRWLPLGQKADTQEVVSQLDWGSYPFWVFMAVGSFLLIPIVEELFYRGYVQTRLAEDFEAPAAILVTALFFAFSHGQYYLTLSPWTVGTLLTLLFSALAWGYVFYRTRSLLPVIIAHALVNFPVRGVVDFILPVVMLVLVVIFRQPILESFRDFGKLFRAKGLFTIGLAAACLFIVGFAVAVALAQELALLFSILALVVALVLEFGEKRRLKATGN